MAIAARLIEAAQDRAAGGIVAVGDDVAQHGERRAAAGDEQDPLLSGEVHRQQDDGDVEHGDGDIERRDRVDDEDGDGDDGRQQRHDERRADRY